MWYVFRGEKATYFANDALVLIYGVIKLVKEVKSNEVVKWNCKQFLKNKNSALKWFFNEDNFLGIAEKEIKWTKKCRKNVRTKRIYVI